VQARISSADKATAFPEAANINPITSREEDPIWLEKLLFVGYGSYLR
jgi:hypothetical protein